MTKTLLCYGDSNTHGTVALQELGVFHRFDRATRWPGIVASRLGSDWHVIEEGQPGRTTVHDDPIEGAHRNGLTVLPSILESHRPIDLVVLMLGTNDLKPRFSVPARDISLSIERLIGVIQNSACGPDSGAPTVLLVAPVPIKEAGVMKEIFEGGTAKAEELSVLYQLVADKMGCLFVDAGTVTQTDPVDGIHLTKEAHLAIADLIHTKIEREFS